MTLTQTLIQGSHYSFPIAQAIFMFLLFLLIIPDSEFLLLLNWLNYQIISLFTLCPFSVQFVSLLDCSLIPLLSKISLHDLCKGGACILNCNAQLKIELKLFPFFPNLWSLQSQQFLTGHFIFSQAQLLTLLLIVSSAFTDSFPFLCAPPPSKNTCGR